MSSVGRASGNFGVGHPKFQPGTFVPGSRFANRASFDANQAVCPVCPVLEWPLLKYTLTIITPGLGNNYKQQQDPPPPLSFGLLKASVTQLHNLSSLFFHFTLHYTDDGSAGQKYNLTACVCPVSPTTQAAKQLNLSWGWHVKITQGQWMNLNSFLNELEMSVLMLITCMADYLLRL